MMVISPAIPPTTPPVITPTLDRLPDVGSDELIADIAGKALVAVRSLAAKLVFRYTAKSLASPSQPEDGAVAVARPSALKLVSNDQI